MPAGLITMAYIGAIVLFILALGGLSQQETARRGNLFGIVGMAIALLATIFGVVTDNLSLMLLAMLAGGAVGLVLARKVQMTQMPELVAILHSLVGLAAVLVGFGTFLGDGGEFSGVEQRIHDVEIYLGVLIGALTFSGSVIAFLKLSARISGSPLLLPGRHFFNLALLLAAAYFLVAFV